MEIRKLLDAIWDMVESSELDGDKIPDLDTCERELQISFANKQNEVIKSVSGMWSMSDDEFDKAIKDL